MSIPELEPGAEGAARGCRSCATPLADGQRYCLNCGQRQGAQRVESGPVLTAIAAASLAATAAGESPPVALDPPSEPAGDGSPGGDGTSATGGGTLATAFASKSAAGTGLALLIVGMVAGAAFSPPATDSIAAQQRIVIVQAPGAAATGPAADPAVDGGGGTETVYVTEPAPAVPAPTPAPAPAPAPAPDPGPDPAPVPVDPTIGHFAFVLLPGGGEGQSLVQSGSAAAKSSASRRGRAAASALDYRSALAPIVKKGFLLKGFRQVSGSGFGNRLALLTGLKPSDGVTSGCEAADPPGSVDGKCVVASSGAGDASDLVSLATQSLATQSQAIRVYVETPEREDDESTPQREDLDHSTLCRPPKPGDPLGFNSDGTPPISDNPVLWLRSLTGPAPDDPGTWDPAASSLCFTAAREGSIRPLSMLEDDLRRAAAQDSENFDPTLPSAFPKITFIIPSRCRVDASVKCPDGVTNGGPGALKAFVSGPVASTLAKSDIFNKDGATVLAWDRPAAGRAPADPLGALVLSAFTRPGASNSSAYTTFSLTATVQRRFGLAGDPGQPAMLGLSSKAKALGAEIFPKQ